MIRASRPWRFRLLSLCAVVFLIGISASQPVSAHGELEEARSDPSPGSVFGVPPERVDLWFTEPLAPGGSAIEVYDAERRRVDAGDARIDPNDAAHLVVALQPLVDGTYTVAWRSVSETDGHALQGTFTFRVGQSRLPAGAATTAGEQPSVPAVIVRWLTLLGLALPAGWFLIVLLGATPEPRRGLIALGGSLVALLADLALVPVQAYWPPAGLPRQPLSDVVGMMPQSWTLRLGAEVALIMAVVLVIRRRARLGALVGVMLAAVAVLLLVPASHAAALQDNRHLALVISALHLEAVVFWLGGVGQWAASPAVRQSLSSLALRRFSRLALLLAVVAMVTGALSAGFLLPSIGSLWTSDYGRLLLLKTAIVLGILGFAWLNRRRLRAGVARLGALLRSLRVEAGLGATTLLVAGLLALSAPPLSADVRPLDLRVSVGPDTFVHLKFDRADIGRRDLLVWLAHQDGAPVLDVQGALLTVSMLERPIDFYTMQLDRRADGRWLARDVPLTVKGWWQANVQFTGLESDLDQAGFVFLLPDPTRFAPERERENDERAEQLFNQALEQLLSLRSVQTTEALADGVGKSLTTTYRFVAPDRLSYSNYAGESVAIGWDQYYSEEDGSWSYRERVDPVQFPATLNSYYSHASGFTLGRFVELDGHGYQIVTFYVPEISGRDESWYIWWIDPETSRVKFEGMAGVYHYMHNTFSDYNAPIEIQRPVADTS